MRRKSKSTARPKGAQRRSHQRLVRSFWNGGEVRLNEDKSVDEIVARGVDVHLEQMDDGFWWMGISGKQGRRLAVQFFRKGKSIHLSVEDDGDYSSGICEGFMASKALPLFRKTPNSD